MFVMLFGGMARVGKTDAADMLETEARAKGFFPKRISFASPLKEQVAEDNGYGKNWRRFKAEHPDLYREQCQTIGEAARAVDPDHWVNLWKETLYREMRIEIGRDRGKETWRETVIIVDDCRYENELEAVREFDHIACFIAAGKRQLEDIDADWRAHESERFSMLSEAMVPETEGIWDWWIVNDGSRDDLQLKIIDRSKYFIGNHPSRFLGRNCDCAQCISFRADIQMEELTDSLRAVLDELLENDDLKDDDRDRLEAAFEALIKKLENGEAKTEDFFTGQWWLKAISEIDDLGLDIPIQNDDSEEDDEDDD
ncbi:MAG: hypothetical protein GY871_03480 [Actinomycetales bacterium]|nr:hypothetical protein [Actinomycetales bacterium]